MRENARETRLPESEQLRQQAEETLKSQSVRPGSQSSGALLGDEAFALVHELRVHQIELELQNEELVRTRQEAEALRDRYIDLYDFAPVGYVTLDDAGTIREVNLTASVLLSMNRQSLIGTRFGAFLHPESLSSFTGFCDRVRRTGLTETCDLVMQGSHGDRPWNAQLKGRAELRRPGGDDRIRLVISDVTESRRAEEAVAESERHYRRLFDTMLQGVVYQDANGRIVSMNPAAEQILGKSPDEFLNMTSKETEHPTIREDGTPFPAQERPAMVALRTGHEVMDVVMGVYNPREHGYHWITIQAVPLFHPGEATPYQVYTIFSDINKRKKAEEALKEYGEKLQASNEELQRFAYIASHDLQEPLRSIVSFSQLLDKRYRGRLDADADEYLRYIVDGGQRMQALIQDLLMLSRVETSALPLVPADLHEIVAGALLVLETPIREANATVTVGDLPRVMADLAQLEQVFTNLIGNAVKYHRPGVPPVISVWAEQVGKCWRFAVADNGIGIEEEYFDRIFQMFQRLHTQAEYSGTGIGLAIVRKIVERHGGRVSVESTPGKGSTFYFTLPAV